MGTSLHGKSSASGKEPKLLASSKETSSQRSEITPSRCDGWLLPKKGKAHQPLCRGPNPVWAHGARSACWFGRMTKLCFLFQLVNLLWNYQLDRLVVTSKSQLREAVCERRSVGSRPAPSPTCIVKPPCKKSMILSIRLWRTKMRVSTLCN